MEEWVRASVADVRDFLRMLWRSNLPRVTLLLGLGLTLGGLAINLSEGRQRDAFSSFWTSVWWALVSMTSTGYGDIVPLTPLGRVIGSLVILSGVVLVSFFTATISSLFVAAKIREGKGLEQVHYHDHVVVCGYGQLTQRLLDALKTISGRKPVRVTLVADVPGGDAEELIARYQELGFKFVRGDWTHEGILKRAGVPTARAVVVLPDEGLQSAGLRDEKTVLATLAVKALNPKARLLAHISLPDNRIFLQRAQADEISIADELTGYLLASRTMTSGLPQAARDMFTSTSPTRLSVSPIPPELVGTTFADAADHFFKRGAILIGLTREETPLEAADILTADSSALDEFIRRKFQEAGLDSAEKTLTKARINPSRDTVIDARDEAFVIGALE